MITSMVLPFSLLAIAVPLAIAQQVALLPTTLPACAQTCSTLQAAQTGCVPPAAPVTTDAIYVSCFCQSALLTSVRASGTNVCSGICSDADFATIYNWYKGFCNIDGATTPTTTSTTAAAAATTAGAAAAAATTGLDGASSTDQSWISTHYRWIVMLAVLAVVFALIGIVGTVLHKRYRRRREAAENGGPRPDLQAWGPNQDNVHDLGMRTAGEVSRSTAEKGKGREDAPGVSREPGSKRLKKGSFRKA